MNTDTHRLAKVLVAAITVLFLMAGQALAQPCGGYEVTAIVSMEKCPPFGIPPVVPFGINDQGWMVGFFNSCVVGPNRAFLWTPDDGLVVIPMPPQTTQSRALAISGSKVVGVHVISGDEFGDLGFLYDYATDEFTSLGPLPGGNTSLARGINSAGEIVGSWGDVVKGPFPLAFIWREGEMIDINPDFGTDSSRALDINADGLVTGWMGTSNINDSHAFIWDDGNVSELPFVPGGFTSEGHAINSHGDVAGWGRVQDIPVVVHGFIWTNGEMTDIGTLPGFESTTTRAMNDARVVVGAAEDPGQRAFVWQNGVLTALNDLIPPRLGLNITLATGINNAGQITAKASGPDGIVAVLLTPIDGPLGDLNGDCEVGVGDLLILLASWGLCKECDADLDGNGTVGVKDLLILLGNWG